MRRFISVLCVTALIALLTPPVYASQKLQTSFEGSVSYLSDEYKTKNDFTGVIVKYNQEESPDDYVEFKIRFDEGGEWSEWVGVRPDEDFMDGDEHAGHNDEFLINTNLSDGYQIYVEMITGPDEIIPRIDIEKLTFINAKSGAISTSTAAFEINSNPNIISRSEWGANESLGYGKAVEVTDEEHEDIDRVQYEVNGKELVWPRQYAADIKMLSVHHSASVSDLDNPKQAIRNIYYYHTVRRGWGDIGYNYIIDTDGRIYEGRAGGEMVVGGHSVAINKASIGVAVLGNYQTQEVPREVINGLVNVLSSKADKYNLDVLDKVSYNSKNYPVLGGHKDSAATACPGANLYQALPTIRYLVSGAEIYKDRTKLSQRKYAYIDEEPIKDMVDLKLGETKSVSITLENVGTNGWNPDSTYLKVNNYNDIKDVIQVSSSKIANISSYVSTGQKTTINFNITGGLGTGFHGLELLLTMNGSAQPDLPIFVPVYMDNDFTFNVSGSRKFDMSLKPGETKNLTVTIKNTSDIDWNNEYRVLLRQSDGSTSKVLTNSNVLGSISKGQSSTVNLALKAPTKNGVYKEYLVPAFENGYPFKGTAIEVTLNVGGTSIAKTTPVKIDRPLVLNSSVSVETKESKYHTFELVNKTNTTWQRSKFNITKIGHNSINIQELALVESSVAPGEVGTIRMKITASKAGTYKYQFRFYNGKSLIYTTPYRLTISTLGTPVKLEPTTNNVEKITVIPKVEAQDAPPVTQVDPPIVSSTSFGPNIRVLLSVFRINKTDVSMHGLTDIYVDGSKFASGTAIDNASVSVSGPDLVKVVINGKSLTGGIIRFVPTSQSGTLTLTDLQNRPAWNTSLNDNRFRGSMEFRMDNGTLIAINELPMELYLMGLGEVSNGTNIETMKTILTAARSYAYFYVTDGTKFAGKPYHLDDSPARSQKYLGYGFEQRSPNVTTAVNQTTGKVVTYDGKVIKVPYFSRSDGQTKSAQEVWGWTDTPYLVSVSDPYCEGQTPAGHGVGISGCGADGMAKSGQNHEDIIKYFLQGVGFDYKY